MAAQSDLIAVLLEAISVCMNQERLSSSHLRGLGHPRYHYLGNW
jgi:hypothetical protein